MLGSSFRSLPSAVLPRAGRGKQLAVSLLAAAFLAGCGTSGGKDETSLRRVQGAGYSFRAPADWRTTRKLRVVQAARERPPSLVSVSTFPLARPYTPELWPKVMPQLDAVAHELAKRLGGRVAAARTQTIGGRRGRRYELVVPSSAVRRRIAFVLDGRTEYQLFCRFRKDDAEALRACKELLASFRFG
jgi:hypothetical protein